METGELKQERINIAIAEDDPLHLFLIQKLIKPNKRFQVAFTATNGEELIEQLEAAVTAPDICILDVSMPSCRATRPCLPCRNAGPK